REELGKDLWKYAKALELSEAENDLQKYFENWHRALSDKQALQQQLQSAQQELKRLDQERHMYKSSSEVFYERLKKVDEERQKLIEGLRWYADEDTHMIKRRSDGDYAPIVLDHGKRARDILKE